MNQQYEQQGGGTIEIIRNLQTRNVGRAMGLNDSDFCIVKRFGLRNGRPTFALAYDRGGRMFPIPITSVAGLPMGMVRDAMKNIKRGARLLRRLVNRCDSADARAMLANITADPSDPLYVANVVIAVANMQQLGDVIAPLTEAELMAAQSIPVFLRLAPCNSGA
jgi:hypothetical protein